MMEKYLPYLQKIQDFEPALIETLNAWCAIHSGSNHIAGLNEMLSVVKQLFSSLNGTMETLPLPPQHRLTLSGELESLPLGEALIITKRPAAPIQVVLGGHLDIALDKDSLLNPPKLLDKNTLCGRGTADMKSGLLILFTALKTLESSPFAESIGWKVILNPDEELGSPGSHPLFLNCANHYHLGMIFEPSLPDGNLVCQRKGSANFTITAQGQAAHVGRDFSRGRNAITALARWALDAENFTNLAAGITVNIASINGGGPTNCVPDQAICRFNVRVDTAADLIIFKDQLNLLVKKENLNEGISLKLHCDTERQPKPFDAKAKKLFEAFKYSAEQLDVSIDWHPTGGVCDGNLLASVGIPTIDTLGAVGGHLHSHEEYIKIDSMVERAQLAALFLMQLATKEIEIP